MRKKSVDTIPVLSDHIENVLSSFSKSRSLPGGLVKRSNIILMASQGFTNRAIAKQIGLHFNNVATWRNRFLKALPALLEIEAGNPDKLGDEIKLVLSDLKRPGAPPEFVAEQIVRIIDLACKSPEDFGYEVSHWNLPLLVKEIKKQGIAEQISEKTVSRFLKMEVNLKLHKIRYWLHSSEKTEDPDAFIDKVNEICKLYHDAPGLSRHKTHVVSADEMTGIQALEHKYPDKLPLPGKTATREFEYIRHGTTSLIGCFDVAEGSIYPPYLNKSEPRRISVRRFRRLSARHRRTTGCLFVTA